MQSKLEQLRAGFDPSLPLYVLVDPMAGEPLSGMGITERGVDPSPYRAHAWGRDIVQVMLASSIALPAHQHPYLICLHGANDALLELTYGTAEEERLAAQAGGLDGTGRAAHRIGGWLQSDTQPAVLAGVLARICRLSVLTPTRATYLRVVDRRVLDLLCHVVDERRVVDQFGPLRSWTFLNAVGDICQVHSSGNPVGRLTFSLQEWRQMERGAILHQSIARYLGEEAVAGKSSGHPGYVAAYNALAGATHAKTRWPQRFMTRDDEVVWAAMSMRWPSLYDNLAVQKLLDAVEDEQAPPEPLRYLHRDIVAISQRTNSTLAHQL